METLETLQPKERFCIQSQEEADWAVSLLADLEAKEARITAQYHKMLAQLQTDKNAWHARFASELEHFARLELERSKAKRKSLTLFNGTLAFRTVPPRISVVDEAEAMRVARLECPAAIIVVPASEKLDKRLLGEYAKQKLAQEGVILDGFDLSESREAFDVKLPKPGRGEGDEE